jgi:hypothetical protein
LGDLVFERRTLLKWNKNNVEVHAVSVWFRILSSDRNFVIRKWNFRFHKMVRIFLTG